MGSRHAEVRVRLAGRRWALVDVEMADLIRQCWRLGIETRSCCQGGPERVDLAEMSMFGRRAGYAYVQFERADDASRFVVLLHSDVDETDRRLHDPEWFEARLLGYTIAPPFWFWQTMPSVWEPGRFSVSAHFPPTDIAEIVRRLAAAEGL